MSLWVPTMAPCALRMTSWVPSIAHRVAKMAPWNPSMALCVLSRAQGFFTAAPTFPIPRMLPLKCLIGFPQFQFWLPESFTWFFRSLKLLRLYYALQNIKHGSLSLQHASLKAKGFPGASLTRQILHPDGVLCPIYRVLEQKQIHNYVLYINWEWIH